MSEPLVCSYKETLGKHEFRYLNGNGGISHDCSNEVEPLLLTLCQPL